MPGLEPKSPIKFDERYSAALLRFDDFGIRHEGAAESAFRSLSTPTGRHQREVSI
ncbi:MAG: hypothetical protein HY043_20995 [Verrucomicrobia bacterium]|nr:hypothetical protein [Verrucomicrobiota bacterium]